MKRWILAALIALTVAFAWIHSAMPVPVSQGESGQVLAFLRPFLRLFLPDHMVTDHLVRKLAHFAEYAALGVEAALYTAVVYKICLNSFIRILYFGATIALIDETIQIFSGRGPMIADLWLDIAGCAAGALVIAVICLVISKKKDKQKAVSDQALV